MEEILRPDILNVEHIFGKVLLALNDSYCIGEQNNDGTIQYETHPSFWKKIGIENPAFGMQWMEHIEESERALFLAQVNVFMVSSEPAFVTHVPILNSKKEQLHFIVQTVRLGPSNNGKQSFLFMLKDVSEKRRERQLLKEGQRIVRMGYWVWDMVSNSINWSDVTREIHEVDKHYVPNLETGVNFYKEGTSRETISKVMEHTIATGQPFATELVLVTAKGNEVWVESRGKIDYENGKPIRMYGTFQDISKRKDIEEKLRINEESFRGAFENAAIGMAIVGPKGEWLKVNPSLTRIVGYEYDELAKLTFADITHPEDLEKGLKELEKLIKGEIESYQIEKRYLHKDGHVVWIILSVSKVANAEGEPLYFISQITDITERKLAQEDLRQALSRNQGILDASIGVSIISTNLEGVITKFNSGAEGMLGYTSEEVVNKQSPALFHKMDEIIERSKELSEQFGQEIVGFDTFVYLAKKEGIESREWTYINKSGKEFPVQLVVTAIRNEEGEIIGYLGLATDITERKQSDHMEKQLAILKSKSKEMEQFAYITSHDLREPLLTITNYIGLIESDFSDEWSAEAKKFFGYISQSASHLNELIGGLLSYSRLSNTNLKEKVDFKEQVNQAITNLTQAINESNAKIEVGDLPIIDGYTSHIYVLVQNLIQNAIKFRATDRVPHVKIYAEENRDENRIYIVDNGIGIEEKYREKVFTIFQRLNEKSLYSGTGLGLALVKKVMEVHGAGVKIHSNENGEGTCFELIFPKPF